MVMRTHGVENVQIEMIYSSVKQNEKSVVMMAVHCQIDSIPSSSARIDWRLVLVLPD